MCEDKISYKTIHIKPTRTFTVNATVKQVKRGTIKNIDKTVIEE